MQLKTTVFKPEMLLSLLLGIVHDDFPKKVPFPLSVIKVKDALYEKQAHCSHETRHALDHFLTSIATNFSRFLNDFAKKATITTTSKTNTTFCCIVYIGKVERMGLRTI